MNNAPGAAPRCRACAAEVPADATRCPHCGAPLGKPDPCPLCRGEGGLSPDSELRFVCDLCGGPRVPHAAGSQASSGREVPFLQKADVARKARGVWRGTAIGSGIGLTLALVPFLLLLIVIGPNLLVLLPGLFFTGLFAAMLSVSLGRARQKGKEIAPALDAAWLAAAGDLARAGHGSIDAAELSKKLGLDEAKAEELSAMIAVDEAVGNVIAPVTAAGRVRIVTEPGAPLPPDPAFEALEKAAEEEAAAEAQAQAAQQRKI
ncbi:MAG: zinc ribbon domain-containing protein [Minicystis sp.]